MRIKRGERDTRHRVKGFLIEKVRETCIYKYLYVSLCVDSTTTHEEGEGETS